MDDLLTTHEVQALLQEIVDARLPIWSALFISPKMAELKNQAPLREHNAHLAEEHVELPVAYIVTLAFRAADAVAIYAELARLATAHGAYILSETIAQHEWEHRFKLMTIKRLGPSLVPAELIVPLAGLADTLDEFTQKVGQPLVKEGVVLRQGAERAILVGTSGGAAVALLLAIAAPERVRAVIADSVVALVPAAALRVLLAERALRTEGQVAFWRTAHGDDWSQVVDADTAMLAGHIEAGLDYFQGRLGQIVCPVLLTASLTDSLLPEVGPQLCAMARQIAQSRLLLVNAGDHPLMWSRPGDFRATADVFLGMLPQYDS